MDNDMFNIYNHGISVLVMSNCSSTIKIKLFIYEALTSLVVINCVTSQRYNNKQFVTKHLLDFFVYWTMINISWRNWYVVWRQRGRWQRLRVGTQLIKAHNQVCSSAGPALWIYDVPDRRLSHANDLPTAHGPLRTHILFYSRYCDVMSW